MIRIQNLFFIVSLILCFQACETKTTGKIRRPIDPMAFRSVLDKKPRMLTLALDTACYVSYDLAGCNLYKAWKGGVLLEGAAYTNKKNVQPTTWGTSYFSDSLNQSGWMAELGGKNDLLRIISKGYVFRDNQIYLKYALILSAGDTVHIEERPEFIRSGSGSPGLERLFTLSGVPGGVAISIKSGNTSFKLNANKSSRLITYFKSLPAQVPPVQEEGYDHRGRYFMEKSDCFTCHELDKKTVGPSLHQIAQRYLRQKNAAQPLVLKVKSGGAGVWGNARMNAHPDLKETEIKTMLDYILSLKTTESKEADPEPKAEKVKTKKYLKPGFGAALEGVHPSYDVRTIHKQDFKPRVGGLAFLPDGRLLVTTWDRVGGVYLLDGVSTGDT